MRYAEMHLHLLIGQSNMAGAGEILPNDEVPVEGIFMLNDEDTWEPARHPLDPSRIERGGFSFGLDFAKTIRHSCNCRIGLIPCAVGGTPLIRWQQGGDLYENALRRAKIAMNDGVMKAILWHQGENDGCRQHDADTYLDRLSRMIHDIREDLGNMNLPFIVGELGRFCLDIPPKFKQSRHTVVKALQEIPSRVPHTACVSSEGLGHKGDDLHFDRAALIEFGRRYAQALDAVEKM